MMGDLPDSGLERSFLFYWRALAGDLPQPSMQYRFHPVRRWKADFAWPEYRILVEMEGLRKRGKSRHTTLMGYTKDCEKYREAQIAGWIVLRFTQLDLKSPDNMISAVRRAMVFRGQEADGKTTH